MALPPRTPNRTSIREQGVQILRLLHPSLVAAAEALVNLHQHRSELSAAFDSLSVGMVILAPSGVVKHRNQRARSILEDPVVGPRARAALADVAVSQGRSQASDVPHAHVDTPCGTFRLTSTLADSSLIGVPSRRIVLIRRNASRPSDLQAAADAGLTARETQVALALAQRRTNKEIAAALGISPHTARHHTERVMMRLGIHSRRDVVQRLSGVDSEAEGTP